MYSTASHDPDEVSSFARKRWGLPPFIYSILVIDESRKKISREVIKLAYRDENIALIGPEGVGKTTLLYKILKDLLNMNEDIVIIEGARDLIGREHEFLFYDAIDENEEMIRILKKITPKRLIVTAKKSEWEKIPEEVKNKFKIIEVPPFSDEDLFLVFSNYFNIQGVGFNEDALRELVSKAKGMPKEVEIFFKELSRLGLLYIDKEIVRKLIPLQESKRILDEIYGEIRRIKEEMVSLDDVTRLKRIASSLEEKGLYSKALEVYRQVLTLNPRDTQALNAIKEIVGIGYIYKSDGHAGAVYSLSWSPDGRYLASASADGTVIIWDTFSNRVVRRFEHDGKVYTVVWSPDSYYIIAGTSEGKIHVWDVRDCREQCILLGHAGAVYSLSWSPDGRYLASASADGTVIIWNFESKKIFKTLVEKSGEIFSVAWNPKEDIIASGNENGKITLWKKTGKIIGILEGHIDQVRSLTWDKTGKILASGGKDRRVILWEVETGKKLLEIKDFNGTVWDIARSPDDEEIAIVASDDTIKKTHDKVIMVYNKIGTLLKNFSKLYAKDTFSVVWDHKKRLFLGACDGTIYIIDLELGDITKELKSSLPLFRSVNWSRTGATFATAGSDGAIYIWSYENKNVLRRLEGHERDVSSIVWDPKGVLLASAGFDNKIVLWDTTTWMKYKELQGPSWMVDKIDWDPVGKYLVSTSREEAIYVWSRELENPIKKLAGHTDIVRVAKWNPDGKYIASGGNDEQVIIWDFNSAEQIVALPHDGWVLSLDWNPRDKMIAVGTRKGYIYLWNTEDWSMIDRRDAYKSLVYCLEWSPDGTMLASASRNRRLTIWDKNIKMIRNYNLPSMAISISWSKDGKKILVSCLNRDLLVIDLGDI